MKTKIKPELLALLAARGTTPWKVIEQANVGRHGACVFAGKRSGGVTRKRLAKFLTAAELKVLGWEAAAPAGLKTLQELVFAREDEAVATVTAMLAAYSGNRAAIMRIVLALADHPEIFGAVADGESYLERAAAWLEQQVQSHKLEAAA